LHNHNKGITTLESIWNTCTSVLRANGKKVHPEYDHQLD
jgi:hypothetical protein